MNKKKKMTVVEVSKFFGVSRAAVYKWVNAGLKGEEERVIGIKPRLVFTEQNLKDFFKVDDLNKLKR